MPAAWADCPSAIYIGYEGKGGNGGGATLKKESSGLPAVHSVFVLEKSFAIKGESSAPPAIQNI